MGCMLASLGYWFMFKERDVYIDFQGLFPLLGWISLMALHALGGAYALYACRRPGSRTAKTTIRCYFSAALLVHTWVALDYSGWDERLMLAAQDVLQPADVKLHSYLDSGEVEPAQLRALLREGADGDSWRREWALWKAFAGGNPENVELLLAAGAGADRLSRSGTSYLTFTYRVDGPLERLLLRRDKRNTLLCEVLLQRGRHMHSSDYSLLNKLLAHGADPQQHCAFRRPVSVQGLAALSRDPQVVGLLSRTAAAPATAADREFTLSGLQSSAAQGHTALLTAFMHWLPAAVYPQAYARALTAAVENNRPAAAMQLLEAGARLPRKDGILFAVQQSHGHRALLQALITSGQDINYRHNRQASALGYAVQQKDLALINTLLELGADLQQTNVRYGLLHKIFAAQSPLRETLAQRLLQAGADPERRDSNHHTFLQRSVYADQAALVALALQFNADRNVKTRRGQSLQDLALQHASDDILNLLEITAPRPGPDINQLTWAAEYSPLQKVKELIANGYPVNGVDRRGRTPLETASRKNRPEIYNFLLRAGADAQLWIADGSKLVNANRASSAASVRRLRGLQKNQDPAFSLLAAAALAGRAELTAELMRWGAQPNRKAASNGDSVLHLVAQAGSRRDEITRVLLAGGADPAALNGNGYTPLTLAAAHRAIKMIEVLHNHGVDINSADRDGRTAMSETLRAGSVIEHLQILLDLGAVASADDLAYAKRRAGPSTWDLLESP